MIARGYVTLRSKHKVSYQRSHVQHVSIGDFYVTDGEADVIFDWLDVSAGTFIDEEGHLVASIELREFDEELFSESNDGRIPFTLDGMKKLVSLPLKEVYNEVFIGNRQFEFMLVKDFGIVIWDEEDNRTSLRFSTKSLDHCNALAEKQWLEEQVA
ncbi:hypothetical protein [Cytobacillus oceanisediminis]|uniref:hypothetical protein n=1 Tax=Cytobacillus oceanisediminis TaxID=665099 RepID=UPI001FB3346D|nr:hypothetical protein [Cytobacillus oceanisediminis]UOE58180.1 hypothetical protein IRB79_27120 [Cytobacillus oceanisediminis]